MIIGFDIDGILTECGCELNYDDKNKNVWKHFFENYLNREIIRTGNSYDFSKAYNLSKKEMIDFFENEMINIIPKFKVNRNIKTIIDTIYYNNIPDNIYIITARDNNKEIINATKEWLKINNIKYNKIFFTKNKGKLAEKLGIDFFFEDNIDHARDLKEHNIKVFMLGKYHNQPENHINHPAYKFSNNREKLMNSFFNIYMFRKLYF